MFNHFVDFIKNLSLSVKIFMVTLAVSIILMIIGIAAHVVALIVIAAIAFVVSTVVIIVLLYAHFNGVPVVEENKKRKARNIILSRDKIEIRELAKMLSLTEPNTRRVVFECIKDNSINDYRFKGDTIERVCGTVNEEPQIVDSEPISAQSEVVVTCDGCGATFVSETKVKQCPYCGRYND